MKTMVCVPCMDTVQTDFVRSLVAMRPVGDVVPEFVAGSVVYHSRNRLAQKAVEEGYDFTLWLDSDMVFPPNLMEVLMEDMTGKNLVTGVCHMRRPPYRPCIWKTLRQGIDMEENQSVGYDDYPRGGMFQVEGCGFACIMVRTGVIKDVIARYSEAFAPLPGYGEDLSFCIRARACGHQIYCDPRLQIGHIAQTIVTDNTFRAFRRAEEERKRREQHAE